MTNRFTAGKRRTLVLIQRFISASRRFNGLPEAATINLWSLSSTITTRSLTTLSSILESWERRSRSADAHLIVGEIEDLRPERIVISPGPCTPQEAGISIELIRRFAGKVPLLGVCLGHQAIGAAFGGQVVRARNLMHGKTSQVEHDGKTIFRGLNSPMTATRYHSLIVAEEDLPKELEISASTTDKDGSRVIMGLRHREFPVEGVQFHPESVLTDEGKQLVKNFLSVGC